MWHFSFDDDMRVLPSANFVRFLRAFLQVLTGKKNVLNES